MLESGFFRAQREQGAALEIPCADPFCGRWAGPRGDCYYPSRGMGARATVDGDSSRPVYSAGDRFIRSRSPGIDWPVSSETAAVDESHDPSGSTWAEAVRGARIRMTSGRRLCARLSLFGRSGAGEVHARSGVAVELEVDADGVDTALTIGLETGVESAR